MLPISSDEAVSMPLLTARLTELVSATSRATVAELAGVSCESIRRWLTGQPPSLTALCRLTRMMGVSLEWLIFHSEGDQSNPVLLQDASIDELLDAIGRRIAGTASLPSSPSQTIHHPRAQESTATHPALRPAPAAAIESKSVGWLLLLGPAHGLVVTSTQICPPRKLTVYSPSDGNWQVFPHDAPAAGDQMIEYEHFCGRTFRWVPSHSALRPHRRYLMPTHTDPASLAQPAQDRSESTQPSPQP